jgi:hypothetical protein
VYDTFPSGGFTHVEWTVQVPSLARDPSTVICMPGIKHPLGPTPPDQGVRVNHFRCPLSGFAGIIFTVHVNSGVRIEESNFGYNALDGHSLGAVVLRWEE